MDKKRSFLIFILASYWSSLKAYGPSQVGLAPSIKNRGRGEALTSSSRDTAPLFYNPAGLTYGGFKARVFGAELIYDRKSAQQTQELSKEISSLEEQVTVEKVFSLLDPQTNMYIRPTIRLLDVSLPYLGASNFISMDLASQKSSETILVELSATMGSIAGVSVSFGRLSLGFSQYEIQRLELTSAPRVEQLTQIIDDFKNSRFDNSKSKIQDYTTVRLGAAVGQNVGLMYHLDPDSPTGFGLAILNRGGTRFQYISPDASSQVKALKEKIKEEADTYGFQIEPPDELKEMKNVGFTWGWISKPDNWTSFKLSFDYHDVEHKSLTDHRVIAYELGLDFPDSLAVRLSVPLHHRDSSSDPYIHGGIGRFKIFGSRTENRYETQGGSALFHFGINSRISFITLEVQSFKLRSLEKENLMKEQEGLSVLGELTLMF